MYSMKTQLASKLIEIDFIKYVCELFIELQLSYLAFKQMLVFHFSTFPHKDVSMKERETLTGKLMWAAVQSGSRSLFFVLCLCQPMIEKATLEYSQLYEIYMIG